MHLLFLFLTKCQNAYYNFNNLNMSDTSIVSRYSLSGKLLQTYPDIKTATEAMKTARGFIAKAADDSSNIHTACGYLWRYGKEMEIDMKTLLKKKKYSGGSPLAEQQHTVGQYDLQGNLIATHVNSLTAAKAVGVHCNGIRKVMNGRAMTYGGFIWSWSTKKKIVVDPKIQLLKSGISQYDLNGKWVRSFKSGLEAARITGIGNDNISLAIKGTTLTAGGYLWRRGQALRINISELRKHPHFNGSVLGSHIKAKRQENLDKMSQVAE